MRLLYCVVLHRVLYPNVHANGCQKKKKVQREKERHQKSSACTQNMRNIVRGPKQREQSGIIIPYILLDWIGYEIQALSEPVTWYFLGGSFRERRTKYESLRH